MDNTDLDLGLHTVAEVAKMLRCTPRTIFKYIAAGKLQTVKIGKNYLVSKVDVVKLVSEMGGKPQLSESALQARRENIVKARDALYEKQKKKRGESEKKEKKIESDVDKDKQEHKRKLANERQRRHYALKKAKAAAQSDQTGVAVADVQPETSDSIQEPGMFAGENPPALNS